MGTGLLSPGHVVVLLTIVLVVFGARRLPEVGRSLGSGMREFKHAVSTDDEAEPARIAERAPEQPQP